MATHYKGERISELLERIEELRKTLDENQDASAITADQFVRTTQAYADLAIAKAKLTALQGE